MDAGAFLGGRGGLGSRGGLGGLGGPGGLGGRLFVFSARGVSWVVWSVFSLSV